MENKAKIEQYADLLFQKENFKNEANVYWVRFLLAFGSLIEESYSLEIDCIKLKKEISFCQRAINNSQPVLASSLNRFIDSEIKDYKKRLENIRSSREEAKTELTTIPLYADSKRREIYRRIMKEIHPDLNPDLYSHEEIAKAYEETNTAYRMGDLEALEEIEVRLAVLISKYGGAPGDLEIKDLDIKIAKAEEDIKNITTTDPYQYKYLLADEEATENEKEEYASKIKEYQDYKKSLEKQLATFHIIKEEA